MRFLKNTITPAAIIFDMDGTLVDSTDADFFAWQKLFADYGVQLDREQYFSWLGIRSWDLVKNRLNLEESAIQQALDKKMYYFTEEVKHKGIATIPYATEFLEKLNHFEGKIALATSSRRQKMKMVMEQTGLLKYFKVIVTGEEVQNGKPAPDMFLLAAQRLNVPPAQCLVFEDSKSGVRAAKNANMKCIAIATTHTPEFLQEADLIINSFQELD